MKPKYVISASNGPAGGAPTGAPSAGGGGDFRLAATSDYQVPVVYSREMLSTQSPIDLGLDLSPKELDLM